jgi:hypothetical protein
MPLFKASNGGFSIEWGTGRFHLNLPPGAERRLVLIRKKVRHEAFPNGMPRSVIRFCDGFG